MTDREGYHSAHRLQEVLETLNGVARRQGTETSTLLEIIAISSGMDLDNPDLLTVAGAISALPRKLANELAPREFGELAHAQQGLRKLNEVLSPPNMHKPWSKAFADAESLIYPALAICNLVLDKQTAIQQPAPADLADIAEAARQLLADIRRDSKLPANIRGFVTSSLTSLLVAIDLYWVTGPQKLEDTMDTIVGKILRQKNFDWQEQKSRTVLRRFGKIVTSVAIALALANDIDDLPKTIRDAVHVITEVDSGNELSPPAAIPPPH